ncbi:MAG TPA: universal stress protein [Devosia sp.]|nr:universal stress protein [Devosia sp.]
MVDHSEYRRKFLVVIDETEECDRALTFAAFRVKRTGGTVVLMSVVEPPGFVGLGVEDVLRAEAVEQAERNLDARLARLKAIGDIKVESVIREGDGNEQIERVIGEDRDIAILVLAASTSQDGTSRDSEHRV